ncbi:hypothetical protein HPB52_022857 [Rhipicephalus sanguineus]|uniref:Tc1-like transposase DDE domain-containing protein n=1 Tax=Rhipicephalus sanguineus TaxID=34632 RepID=A0A9D4YQW5_RHISA|nr:hypothetical protein HPB52_022857 [Rhipicephalus sanguineus]
MHPRPTPPLHPGRQTPVRQIHAAAAELAADQRRLLALQEQLLLHNAQQWEANAAMGSSRREEAHSGFKHPRPFPTGDLPVARKVENCGKPCRPNLPRDEANRRERARWKAQIFTQKVFASGRCAVSVWAAMSRQGLGPLVLIDGKWTASKYALIIEQEWVPYVLDGPFKDGCCIFQHDRSPIYTARSVKSLLEDLAVRTLEWPPVGVDLNPIENVWGLIKRQLAARNLGSATKDTLWMAVREEWEALRARPEIVAALYESMPRRVAQVIAADGHLTKY